MSTETQDGEDDLKECVISFLRRNFPQIRIHGSSATIRNLDHETGEVTVFLGGVCSGCGISPMTIQVIKTHMVKEIPEINEIHADTGMGGDGGMGGGSRGGSPSFPDGTSDDTADIEDDQGPQTPF